MERICEICRMFLENDQEAIEHMRLKHGVWLKVEDLHSADQAREKQAIRRAARQEGT